MTDLIVISVNDDGEVSLSVLDEKALRDHLREDYWGKSAFLPHVKKGETLFDLSGKRGLRVISGKQITPTPRQVATDWDF